MSIPIGLLGIRSAAYSADVIGGASSGCPGLIPLRTLLSNGCLISCGAFSNGDGSLAMKLKDKHGSPRYAAQRLLLTDSGHYLLPINNFGKNSNHELDYLAQQQAKIISSSAVEQGFHTDFTTLLVFDVPDENEGTDEILIQTEEPKLFQ